MKTNIYLATTILIAGLAFNPAYAANTTELIKETENTINKAIPAQELKNPRYAAESLLQHANYARVALGMRRNELAQAHIERAIEANNILRNSAPQYRTQRNVLTGRFSYDYGNKNQDHYFPLSQELVEWKELGKGPFWADRQGIAVKEAELVYVSYDIDAEEVSSHLKKALENIRKGEPDEAQSELAELVDDVVEVEKTVELPLEKARDNIVLTRYFLNAGNYEAARYALGHAEDGLEDAKEDDRYSNRREQLNTMSQEIKDLDKAIERKSPSILDSTEKKMKGWWQNLKDWAK